MANPKKLAFGLFCLSVVLMQGCFAEDDEVVIPNEHSVPEKLEHGEKGTLQYKVNTIKLTGSQHHKSDEGIPQKMPWPPRPGRRNVIPLKAKKALSTIIRPDRSIFHSLINKAKRNHPQRFLRPGREDVPNELPPPLLRPGREDVPGRHSYLIRPGRQDVPQEDYTLLLRPGRAAPPQNNRILRPGRNDIPDQFNSVRAGKRSTGYNMPWTYVGSSVNSNLQHNSHTFRQKALEEKTKRTAQDDEQEMSVPNSLLDEQQDLI